MFTLKKALLVSLALLLVGCGKEYPTDTGAITYANRDSPGAKLNVKSVLTPEKMNIIYFYADW